jgi:hypothetical protein
MEVRRRVGWSGLAGRMGREKTHLFLGRFRVLFYSSSACLVLKRRSLVASFAAVAGMFVVRFFARCLWFGVSTPFCRVGRPVGMRKDSWCGGLCEAQWRLGWALVFVMMVGMEIRDARRDPCSPRGASGEEDE